MRNDNVILTAGRVAGLLSTVSAAELIAASNTPGLHPLYRDHMRIIAKCRQELNLPEPEKPHDA